MASGNKKISSSTFQNATSPAATCEQQEQLEQSQGRRSPSLLGNLRKGYQLLHGLLSMKPSTNLRSQVPYKSPEFADPQTSWHLALGWLARVSRRLRLNDLPVPIFDRHGCFDRLESRSLLPDLTCIEESSLPSGKQRHQQQQLGFQGLRDRILRMTGSGDLLRVLSERLLLPDDEATAESGKGGDWGDHTNRKRGGTPAPKRDLLQLPLSFETTAGHQHRSTSKAPNHLAMHLHANHHHHHSNLPLQPEAQASLACCEENFAAFHRFLARVFTCPDKADDNANGAWELRVCLGKQCAECSAVSLLLRSQNSQHHFLLNHATQYPLQRRHQTSSPFDCALSVLLLHLLTLMLLLEEPISQIQQTEVLQLWENRLDLAVLSSSPTVKEMRCIYAQLMAK